MRHGLAPASCTPFHHLSFNQLTLSIVPIPQGQLSRAGFSRLPFLIEREGPKASWRFVEFFTANIRNKNTRAAYAQALGQFFQWCDARRVRELGQLRPVVISIYIEELMARRSTPSVKQHL